MLYFWNLIYTLRDIKIFYKKYLQAVTLLRIFISLTCHFEIYRSIGMIQLIFFSLCFSAGWSILPGYSEYKSEYCPGNSAKFSDDCKMEMRCTNSASTYIQRCSAHGYRLKNEECYSYRWSNYVRRLSTDVICRQNLKGKAAVHSTHMGLLYLQSGPFIPGIAFVTRITQSGTRGPRTAYPSDF